MGTRAAATGSPFFHQSVHADPRFNKVKRIVTTHTLTCCLKGWIPMKAPAIPTSAYLAPGAQIVGDVTLGERCSVWYNAVLRGDCAPIVVGAETNLQDAAVIHCSTGAPAVIGSGVTVGHGAILHSCTIGDGSLIGMSAVNVWWERALSSRRAPSSRTVPLPSAPPPVSSVLLHPRNAPICVKTRRNICSLRSKRWKTEHPFPSFCKTSPCRDVPPFRRILPQGLVALALISFSLPRFPARADTYSPSQQDEA